jgi:translation initiation factor IF-3
VRLIDENKKQIGIVPLQKALSIAESKGLDLVEVAANANPPVCRILDYGKFLYELQKKAHEAKKHQKQIQIKEIKFRPKISIHDYNFKLRHIKRFLEEGNKVKITVMLRGRERAKPEIAHEFIKRVLEDTKDMAIEESSPKTQGFFVSTVLSPIKTGGKNAQTKNTQGSKEKI